MAAVEARAGEWGRRAGELVKARMCWFGAGCERGLDCPCWHTDEEVALFRVSA